MMSNVQELSSLVCVKKKAMDRFLESLRFRKVRRYIPKGARLLDVGTGDGTFLQTLEGHIASGVGIDPLIPEPFDLGTYRLIPGTFPEHLLSCGAPFDIITLLAVVEHIPLEGLTPVAAACSDMLIPGGRVIITAPHPNIDRLLDILKSLRVIHGLSLEEHYGFDPERLPEIFKGWRVLKKERWELGCNYLFIFGKP